MCRILCASCWLDLSLRFGTWTSFSTLAPVPTDFKNILITLPFPGSLFSTQGHHHTGMRGLGGRGGGVRGAVQRKQSGTTENETMHQTPPCPCVKARNAFQGEIHRVQPATCYEDELAWHNPANEKEKPASSAAICCSAFSPLPAAPITGPLCVPLNCALCRPL